MSVKGASYEFKPQQVAGRGGHSIVSMFVRKDRHGLVRAHQGKSGFIGRFHLDDSLGDGRSAVYLEAPARAHVSVSDVPVVERLFAWLASNPGATARGYRASRVGSQHELDAAMAVLIGDGRVAVNPGARGAKLHTVVV